MKNKNIFTAEIIFIIIATASILSLFQFGIVPVKNYIIQRISFNLKIIKLDKSINKLIVDFNKLKYYKKSTHVNNQELLYTAKNIKDDKKTINLEYKNINNYIKIKSYAIYYPKLTSYFYKSYFKWKSIDKPILDRIIKYNEYISPKISIFYIKSLSYLLLPSKIILKTGLSHIQRIYLFYALVFIAGSLIILSLGVLFIYYLLKFLNNLRESENKFKSLFKEHAAVMFLVEEDGKIADANYAASKFYGYSREKLRTMYNYEFNITPKEELVEYTKKAFSKSDSHFTFIHKLANNELRNVEVYISPIHVNNKIYLFSIIHDITEKKQLEDKLRNSENRLKTFFNNLPVASLVVEHESGLIVDVNNKAAEFYGYTKEEFLKMTISVINHFNSIDEIILFRAKALKDGYSYAICSHRLKNGDIKIVEANIAGIIYNNKPYVLILVNDITEKKQLEDKLKKSEKKLEDDMLTLQILVDNIHAGIALYSQDKFIYLNPTIEEIFGFSIGEFYKLNPLEFFNIDEKDILNFNMPIFKRRINNELSSQIIYRYVINGNAAIYLDLFRTVVNYNNEQTGLAIFTDVTEIVLKEQLLMLENETFKELSEVDVLTGIYNRRAFDNKLAEFLDIASRYGRHLSLIMFDIDKFKEINDTYGHEAGDSVLKELSKTVKTGLRKTDFFARYGGEEFMVISPETDISTAKELAERLREQIEIHDFKIEKNITCSFGVTEFNRNNKNDYQSIVSRADTALYEAKRNGRNKVCVK